MVCGYAGSSQDDLQKHAWNLVRLGEDWYEVDPTWDDLELEISPSSEGYDLFLEAISDRDYMAKLHHLQPSVHIRFTPQDSEVTRDYVTPLAPDAEGSMYTWEVLTGRES